MNSCTAKKIDGEPCSCRAQKDSHFCFFHDPERTEQRKAAARRGGKNKRDAIVLVDEAEEGTATGWAYVEEKLVEAIDLLCQGKISTSTANTISYWANGRLQVEKKIKYEDYATVRQREESVQHRERQDLERKFGKTLASFILDPAKRRAMLNVMDIFYWHISPYGLETMRRWKREREQAKEMALKAV